MKKKKSIRITSRHTNTHGCLGTLSFSVRKISQEIREYFFGFVLRYFHRLRTNYDDANMDILLSQHLAIPCMVQLKWSRWPIVDAICEDKLAL